MNRNEFIGKLQMCYFGDRNAFDEIVNEYDELKKENEILQAKLDLYVGTLHENNKLVKRIDEAIDYIKSKKAIINTDCIRIFDLFKIDEQGYTDKLLDILKGEDNV